MKLNGLKGVRDEILQSSLGSAFLFRFRNDDGTLSRPISFVFSGQFANHIILVSKIITQTSQGVEGDGLGIDKIYFWKNNTDGRLFDSVENIDVRFDGNLHDKDVSTTSDRPLTRIVNEARLGEVLAGIGSGGATTTTEITLSAPNQESITTNNGERTQAVLNRWLSAILFVHRDVANNLTTIGFQNYIKDSGTYFEKSPFFYTIDNATQEITRIKIGGGLNDNISISGKTIALGENSQTSTISVVGLLNANTYDTPGGIKPRLTDLSYVPKKYIDENYAALGNIINYTPVDVLRNDFEFIIVPNKIKGEYYQFGDVSSKTLLSSKLLRQNPSIPGINFILQYNESETRLDSGNDAWRRGIRLTFSIPNENDIPSFIYNNGVVGGRAPFKVRVESATLHNQHINNISTCEGNVYYGSKENGLQFYYLELVIDQTFVRGGFVMYIQLEYLPVSVDVNG